MIDVKDLEVGYGDIQIIKNICLGIEKGSFFGIIGPNGSGKTTLLKAMSRLLTPQNGVIYIGEKELSTFSYRELAQEIGVVPQETNINFDFTVMDIVLMGRHPYLERFSSESGEDLEIVRQAMEKTNTTEFANRSVNEISGGERQRVIIARALAQQPEILLLDEATSHLDISHQMEIMNIIRHLKGNVTVVGVFHDLNLASYYCDRLMLIDEGKIQAIGTPAEVLTRENLKNSFNINTIIKTNPLTQKPYVIPIIEDGTDTTGDLHIHLICGGGSGSDLMYNLHEKGYHLTTGVLCVNDTDYETARDLGIHCIAEPPFAAISKKSLGELKGLLDRADVFIVMNLPYGTGNIANLKVLNNYPGKKIFIFTNNSGRTGVDDYTGGAAEKLLTKLVSEGATLISNHNELINCLKMLS